MENNRLSKHIIALQRNIRPFITCSASIRELAKKVGRSKSSVYRALAALKRRKKYPEAILFESEEGRVWLRTIVDPINET